MTIRRLDLAAALTNSSTVTPAASAIGLNASLALSLIEFSAVGSTSVQDSATPNFTSSADSTTHLKPAGKGRFTGVRPEGSGVDGSGDGVEVCVWVWVVVTSGADDGAAWPPDWVTSRQPDSRVEVMTATGTKARLLTQPA